MSTITPIFSRFTPVLPSLSDVSSYGSLLISGKDSVLAGQSSYSHGLSSPIIVQQIAPQSQPQARMGFIDTIEGLRVSILQEFRENVGNKPSKEMNDFSERISLFNPKHIPSPDERMHLFEMARNILSASGVDGDIQVQKIVKMPWCMRLRVSGSQDNASTRYILAMNRLGFEVYYDLRPLFRENATAEFNGAREVVCVSHRFIQDGMPGLNELHDAIHALIYYYLIQFGIVTPFGAVIVAKGESKDFFKGYPAFCYSIEELAANAYELYAAACEIGMLSELAKEGVDCSAAAHSILMKCYSLVKNQWELIGMINDSYYPEWKRALDHKKVNIGTMIVGSATGYRTRPALQCVFIETNESSLHVIVPQDQASGGFKAMLSYSDQTLAKIRELLLDIERQCAHLITPFRGQRGVLGPNVHWLVELMKAPWELTVRPSLPR